MPFGSLALLNACLKSGGIDTIVIDVNAESFRAMIRPETTSRYLGLVDAELERLERRTRLLPAERAYHESLERLRAFPRSLIEGAAAAFEAMRRQDAFLDPEQWIAADRSLRAAHAFFNARTPKFFTRSANFGAQVYPYLEADAVDPYTEYYESGLGPRLARLAPDVIAWSCPYSSQLATAMLASKLLRRRLPGVPIVAGGTGISESVEYGLVDPRFYDYIDHAVTGDGETAILDYCAAVRGERSYASVPGLWRREGGVVAAPADQSIVDMNRAPAPDYRDIDFANYAMPEPTAVYITSRGCYYGKCTFCPDSLRLGFRKRTPEKTYADVKDLVLGQGIRHIHFFDPLTPPVTLEYLARQVAKDGLPLHWYAEVKFEPIYLNKGYVRKLADGGCRQLQFGLESGVQSVLDAMEKGNRLDQIEIILGNLRDVGITTAVTWFIGFPGESEADARETWNFIARHEDSIHLSLFVGKFNMGQGEIVYQNPERFGIRLTRDAFGLVDYEPLDGERWNVDALNATFSARSDVHIAAGGAGLYYASHNPLGLRRIRTASVIGAPAFEAPPIEARRARLPRENHFIELRSEPGEPARGVAFAASFGERHELDAADLALLRAVAAGPMPLAALIEGSPEPDLERRRLVRFIDSGCLSTA